MLGRLAFFPFGGVSSVCVVDVVCFLTLSLCVGVNAIPDSAWRVWFQITFPDAGSIDGQQQGSVRARDEAERYPGTLHLVGWLACFVVVREHSYCCVSQR